MFRERSGIHEVVACGDTPLVTSCTTTVVGKEAAVVEKTCDFLVGMVVLRLMSLVVMLPRI